MQRVVVLFVALAACARVLIAQGSFVEHWERRASATQSRQPAWPPPLITTYPGLIQVARTDFSRQTSSSHVQTWNLDGGKGVNLIPAANSELDLNLSPYLKHSSQAVADGAGDLSFLLKYRFLAGNARHGSYVASAFLTGTVPTGSYKNGSTDASVAPAIGLGKGFGFLDVQTTLSSTLPVHNTPKLGRSIGWNTTIQAHVFQYLWPEVEFNSTFYKGGATDGKAQTFITPGLLVARKIRPGNRTSRLGLCGGAGEQIAATHFHTYNHGIVVTTRVVF